MDPDKRPDKFQQAWHAQSTQTRVTIDADLLRKEVQRNQRNFGSTILRRDVIEVGVGLMLLPYWIYKGLTGSLPWTWWLGVPAIIWVVGYFIVDRIRHPQAPSDPGEPLLKCVTNSLTQMEHQIWLLRNVFWWYLMPFTIAISAFFAHTIWQSSKNWLEVLGRGASLFGFLTGLYCFIDYINQRAVCFDLELRRQELLTLLASLGGEDATVTQTQSTSATRVDIVRILRRWIIVAIVCFIVLAVLVLAAGKFDSSYDGHSRSSGPAGESLAKLITEQRKEKNLVGLAAMVMVDGKVTASAAHGERKIRSGVPLEITDQWHLGGITKSITATMIARLVEAGQMQWTDTVGEIYAEAKVHEDWKRVTLRQLLTDTAGAPANFPNAVLRNRPPLGAESTKARREAVLNLIANKPVYPAGEKSAYSNVGYTILGAMAEKVTGATWEDLLRREVFDPLKLTGVGFGPPKSPDDTLPQPRGHRNVLAGKVSVDDEADNTPIMGPAATIHMTLENLCTFAREHLHGELGTGKLLSGDTYKGLHTPELSYYACGWIRKEPSHEIPYRVYWHNGSNTMWYALVVFIPEKNIVVAVTSNDGDIKNAEAAAWEVVKASVKQFDVKGEAESMAK